MSLPIFHGVSKDLSLLQTAWANIINPVVDLPLVQGLIIKNQALVNGSTVINHRLGRKLQGWIVVRQRAAASIYDTQDSNPSPNLTLTLVSDAVVSVDIYVF